MPKFKRYTEDQLIQAIETSTSIAKVLIKLGLAPKGGNYRFINTYINEHDLDTSNLRGQAWNKGQTFGPRRPLSDYLSNKHSISSHKLRKRLISENMFEQKCSSCGLTTWLDNNIPLELEHKDGNHKNNELSNLCLLCPNCHALTSTYRGKNIKPS